jgi:ribonucleoside-triphosphate reductase
MSKNHKTLIDVESSVKEYLSQADWRVNANANQGYSLGGLILNVSGKVIANYWLNHIYAPEIGEAHRAGDFHIHDLDMLSGYCAGWSLRTLLMEGFNGIPGKVEAKPPKHLSSAVGQMVNFLGTLQNEWAGAQAYSSTDSYLAPLVRKDNLSYKQVKQCIQELIYNLNVPSRWGCVPLDTEILTKDGWKLKDEISTSDKIYGFQNGNIIDDEILAVNEYDFDGELIAFSNRSQEQLLTPNHRVLRLGYNDNKEKFFVDEAKGLFEAKSPVNVPVAGHINQNNYAISDDLLQLYAWILSEGSIPNQSSSDNRIVIHQSPIKNKEYCNEIEGILERLGLTYRKTFRQHGFGKGVDTYRLSRPFSRELSSILKKQELPMDILRKCSERQIKLFIHTYRKGDGEKKRFRIITKDEKIQDDFQELAALVGYGTKVAERKSTLSDNTLYIITFLTKGSGKITLTTKKKVNYKGKVWCPTTGSSYWIARRKGSVFITGNSQTPFTNLTFDWVCPEDLRDQIPYIGGEEMPFSYGDLQAEMDMINRAFIEVMTEGDAKGRIFTFPIPTYNITNDFPWDSPNTDLLFNMTARYGLPYFQGFIRSDLKPNMVRSMCCRLQLDLTELLKRGNGLFGSAEQTGSLGVVTINCARLGYQYKNDEAALYQRLDTLLALGRDSLEVKRQVIQQHMDNGLFPFTKRYLGTLRNHFSTLGVNGINEMIRNFTNDQHDITSEWGQAFAVRLLEHIRARMIEFQEETGHMYNLEATPAEGTTYRFAKEDKKRYPDMIQAGNPERPYYTNSSQLPVGFTDDPFEALELQDELQTKYTGGCIEKGVKVITNKGAFKIEEIVKNFKSLSPLKALSYNQKTGQSEWDLITDAVKIDVARHNKIKVVAKRGVEMTTSDWHPFFVVAEEKIAFNNKCPKCAKPLINLKALGNHLRYTPACQEYYSKLPKYKVIEKRADELVKGDNILQNAQNMLPEKSLLNPDLAYLIGLFLGDGLISETEDNREGDELTQCRVRFFSKTEEGLEKIIPILNRFFDCQAAVIQNDDQSIEKPFMIETTVLTDFLLQYRFVVGQNTSDRNLPSAVKRHLSKENFYSFIMGLIDNNGYIGEKRGYIEYYTVSKRLVEDVIEMFSMAGMVISEKRVRRRSKKHAEFYTHTLFISLPKAIARCGAIFQAEDYNDNVLFNHPARRKRSPVASVLDTSKVEVQDNDFYDLTTEHNHNYLAGNNNFVFVHNTVLHLYMNERISSANACKNLVRRVLERYRLPYITVTPTFSICPVHGYLAGEHDFCPLCDDEKLANKEITNDSKSSK